METKLAKITQLSAEDPNMVFTSVGHFINEEMLKECHFKMEGDKAVGNDGITKEEYGGNPDVNFENLVNRLKRRAYRPQPARRVEIPKDNGKTRPLSIYCYEEMEEVNQILVGYYHYYGITDNFRAIDGFRYRVMRSRFYWLNRRSQKVSYICSQFADMLKVYPLVRPPNICQYIWPIVCIISFVGSRMRENCTSGFEQGYAL